jgi:hypothetical protein
MRIRIRNPESFDPGSGMEKICIRDKHPGSSTLGTRKLAKIAVMFTFSPAVLSNPNRHPVRILQPKICCGKLGRFYRYILPPPPLLILFIFLFQIRRGQVSQAQGGDCRAQS